MKSLLYILSVLELTACGSLRNEVSPSLLTREGEKLVVNGYISPQDTLLSVKVSRSKPVLGEQTDALPYNVADATVTLSDGNKLVVLRYLSDKQFYTAKATLLPIRTGQTYTLTVSTPDGKKVTAQATVPKPVAIRQGHLDSIITTTGNRLQKSYQIGFDWQDPTGEANYYEYSGYFDWSPGYTYPIDGQTVTSSGTGLRLLIFPREDRTGKLITDDRQDGAVLSSLSADIGLVEVAANSPNAQASLKRLTMGNVLPGARVLLRLLSTETLYFRYKDAVIRQRQNRDNPFAEPVLIPTNVQDGLGCFSAYNRSEKVFFLR